MPAATRSRRVSDPLARALEPPPDETPAEREARIEAERAAKKINDEIDEQIKIEQDAIKRKLAKQAEVKLLLLGQSESGKSTTLKQFQLVYAPNSFREERLAWRSVIYLNLVRSVRRIIDTLSASEPELAFDPNDDEETLTTARADSRLSSEAYSRGPSDVQPLSSPTPVSARITELISRLEPLLALEEQLVKQLTGDENDVAAQAAWPSPIVSPNSSPQVPTKNVELSVNYRNNWKKVLNKLARGGRTSISEPEGWWHDLADPVHVLNRCRPDIEALWGDSEVQAALNNRGMRLEESSGFYLDSLPRITALHYIPSDDDVLRARLKTVGVIEHTFSLEIGNERGVDWKIYDVGGSRNQRQAWVPYFLDMNAIIFLAPISAFDQVLAEDPRVNRLEDSLLLWRSLVANKLLDKVHIVLFLNKCDLLKKKLEAGIRLNQYMTSYGDRPNDFESLTKYFSSKFIAIHRSNSANRDRKIYLHLTSVTDTRQTASILTNVRDIIFQNQLKKLDIL